jgi:ABC-2 type transport system permease protein
MPEAAADGTNTTDRPVRDRAIPSPRIAVELARVELRRGGRWVAAQDFWLLYGLVSVFGLAFGSWRAFLLGQDTGAALVAGNSTWFLSGGAGTLWGVVWLFMVGILAVDALGSNGDVPNDGHYLTIRPSADLAAGKLLAAACKFAVFVFTPAVACYLGIAVARDTPLPLLGGLAAATVTVISATAVGYPLGLVVKGVVRRSGALTRLKPALAAAVATAYVAVIATGEATTVIRWVEPLLRAPPLGWLADLSLVTTPGAAVAPTSALAALIASLTIAVLGMVLAIPAARYAWHADRVQPADADNDSDGATTPSHRGTALLGAVTRRPATRAVASTTLLRVYRSPLQLVFVAFPLVTAIPLGESLVTAGTLPWYTPWLAVWYGAWAAGAAIPLNPLGNQGATLPSLLTAPADGRHVVRGHVVAAALPVALPTVGVAVALGVAEGRSVPELAAVGVAAVAAVLAASVLAAGIGSVFPRFEAVDFGGARRAVPPSKVAYSVFSTMLTLAVFSGAVLLDDLVADLGALVVSRWLPFGLDVTTGELTTVAWVVVAAAALSVPVAYRIAIRRVDGYRLS